jgi:hypothetical protein
MATRFLVRVASDGSLVPAHPERTKRYAGKDRWVSLHEAPTLIKRSDSANAYLWGVVYKRISEETGNDPDSIHYGLKREALRIGILDPQYIMLGDRLVEDNPTTVTDSDTFWAYVNWIRQGAEHGDLIGRQFHIPEPNELEEKGARTPGKEGVSAEGSEQGG